MTNIKQKCQLCQLFFRNLSIGERHYLHMSTSCFALVNLRYAVTWINIKKIIKEKKDRTKLPVIAEIQKGGIICRGVLRKQRY